ncbi:type II toxin-antitoxin system RelE family toxin [Niveispirillum sp. KHB5.9]|uniref:type II toxin-antitoxin system RelE family toxin n=1 Tax=Niveispirillum sp. KHB5.9 TaxID=3400269 RepID=UPI003A86DB2C
MAWNITLSAAAEKELQKLGTAEARRILKFLFQRVQPLEDPRSIGEALRSPLGEFWKYRVGDYRIIAEIDDRQVRILIVRIGNRRDIYRH